MLLELTSEGDIVDDNGETHSLFPYDPKALGDDPVE